MTFYAEEKPPDEESDREAKGGEAYPNQEDGGNEDEETCPLVATVEAVAATVEAVAATAWDIVSQHLHRLSRRLDQA